jgi:hypothetical protein
VVVSEAETKSIDAEIARLKVRLEELERRKAGHA